MSKKHEMGTDEYLKYLQSETPGELETSYNESVEEFIKEVKNANDDKKKKHFSMTFDNPLKGFPYNEQFGLDKNLQEKLKGYQSSYKSVSKYNGKEFNRKLEFKTLDKIQKALEVADKHHQDLQYPYVVDTVTRLWDHLAKASVGIIEYKSAIKDGKYDGIIDKDD